MKERVDDNDSSNGIYDNRSLRNEEVSTATVASARYWG